MRDWKQAERKIAAILGGRRVPVSGRQRGDAPDIEHPTLSIEVKSRKSIPAWVENAIEQAEVASRDGKTPAVVLHQDEQKYTDALVVLRLSDFAGLLTNVEIEERQPGRGAGQDPTRKRDAGAGVRTLRTQKRGST